MRDKAIKDYDKELLELLERYEPYRCLAISIREMSDLSGKEYVHSLAWREDSTKPKEVRDANS